MSARGAVLALGLALAGFSPFEAEEGNVRAGNERLHAGDPVAALRRYDDAERAVGRRPEIDFDRGDAALAAGRGAEAEAAFRRAAEAAPPALASRALQNLGSARAAAGDLEGAARAFADALSRDPSNEDARWNLEVLLREREPEGAPREEPGRSPSPAREDAPAAADARRPEPPREGEAAARDARAPEDREWRPGLREPARIRRQDAEALLDALRARERTLPLFGPERKTGRREDVAKDW